MECKNCGNITLAKKLPKMPNDWCTTCYKILLDALSDEVWRLKNG